MLTSGIKRWEHQVAMPSAELTARLRFSLPRSGHSLVGIDSRAQRSFASVAWFYKTRGVTWIQLSDWVTLQRIIIGFIHNDPWQAIFSLVHTPDPRPDLPSVHTAQTRLKPLEKAASRAQMVSALLTPHPLFCNDAKTPGHPKSILCFLSFISLVSCVMNTPDVVSHTDLCPRWLRLVMSRIRDGSAWHVTGSVTHCVALWTLGPGLRPESRGPGSLGPGHCHGGDTGYSGGSGRTGTTRSEREIVSKCFYNHATSFKSFDSFYCLFFSSWIHLI